MELIRIIIIFAIVGSILGYLMNYLYVEMDVEIEKYGLIVFLAIFILFFVLYRNKLQISGWYIGEHRDKLSKVMSKILIFSSIGLLILPLVLSFLGK